MCSFILLSVAFFISLSFLFINFGPSLPPSIPSLFFLFSVYHVFLTSVYVLCVCLFASSFLSLSSLSSLPLNLEQSPLINYNAKLTKKSVCVILLHLFSLSPYSFLPPSVSLSLPSFFFPSFFLMCIMYNLCVSPGDCA